MNTPVSVSLFLVAVLLFTAAYYFKNNSVVAAKHEDTTLRADFEYDFEYETVRQYTDSAGTLHAVVILHNLDDKTHTGPFKVTIERGVLSTLKGPLQYLPKRFAVGAVVWMGETNKGKGFKPFAILILE